MSKKPDEKIGSDFQRAFDIEARAGRWRGVLPSVTDPVEVIEEEHCFLTSDEMAEWTPRGDD